MPGWKEKHRIRLKKNRYLIWPNKADDERVIERKTSIGRGLEPQPIEPNKASESRCIGPQMLREAE